MPQEPSALDGPDPGLEGATPPSADPAPGPPSGTGSLRSRAALSTYATAVQGLARLVYSVLIGHLGSRELLGQTNTSLSLSVFTSQLWAAPASAAGTRFVAAPATLGDPEAAKVVARHIAIRSTRISLVLPTTVALVGSLFLGFSPALRHGRGGAGLPHRLGARVARPPGHRVVGRAAPLGRPRCPGRWS